MERRLAAEITQALLALARRPCNVIYAMMRDGTLYENEPKKHALVPGKTIRAPPFFVAKELYVADDFESTTHTLDSRIQSRFRFHPAEAWNDRSNLSSDLGNSHFNGRVVVPQVKLGNQPFCFQGRIVTD